LFCCVGCFIWVLMRYMEFKLFVKMCAGSFGNSCVRIYKVWWNVSFQHGVCFVVLLVFGGGLFLEVSSRCHIQLVLGPKIHWLVF
jgi:hypothetical protein